MVTRLGDLQGVTGQVTAQVGTVTAQVAGTLTAQVQGGVVSANVLSGNITAHGQVTAHGTITAEAKGTVSAQVLGGVISAQVLSGNITAHGQITAGGEITAHGTITAQVGTVTAGGQITAHGTVTAQVGTLTAVMAPNALTFKAPTAVLVGTTASLLVTADAARRYLALVWEGVSAAYLGVAAAPAVSTGIRLNAGGGSYEMIMGQNLATVAISAISLVSGQMTIQEAT